MLTFDEIKELINRVEQSTIQHFELEHKSSKLVISKNQVYTQPIDASPEALSKAPKGAKREEKPTEDVADYKDKSLHTIVSPTVGTFYAAPEPGADPFVQVGAQLQESTIVCVLEAMKLFNEVEAGVTGQVVELLVKDGDFIEYGQPLFLVKAQD
jgi:acetyl-CoA carboxylase biotin carboxyl carrier protein